MIVTIDTKKCLIIGAITKSACIDNTEHFLNKFQNFCKNYKVEGQVFNADFIFGVEHIKSAVYHAIRAFKTHTNSCKTLALEILLYASAERQLKDAFAKIGIKKGNKRIALVIVGDKIQFEINKLTRALSIIQKQGVLRPVYSNLLKFGIKDVELKTICKKGHELVLEKVALVELEK